MNKFLFSIIVAIYNTEQYLEECIESVINQDVGFEQNVELILVNDGSKDNCEKICLKYVEKFPNNIKYFYQENSGVSAARNNGKNNSTGKYLNFLDSDDKFQKNALKVVKKVFEDDPTLNICTIRPWFFDKVNGATNVDYCFKKNQKVNILEDEGFTQQAVNNIFVNRDIIENHWFDKDVSIGEDALFINSLFLNHPVYYVTKNTKYFQRRRQANDSLSESAFFNKSFYTNTVNKYFINLMQVAINKFKNVPVFLQNDIAAYVAWMLQSNVIEKVLTEKELKTLIRNLKRVASYLDEEIIVNNKNIEPEYKFEMLLLKNIDFGLNFKENSVELISNKDNMEFNYIYANHSLNNYLLDDLGKVILYAIEMNKFYNHTLRDNSRILKINQSLEQEKETIQQKATMLVKEKEIFQQKINELEKEKEIFQQKINELEKDKINLIQYLNNYKKSYDDIIESKSWKITKPLRKLRSVVKTFRR